MDWAIDHIGIAVRDIEAATDFYLSLPGHRLIEEENVEDQIRIKFISCGDSLLELMSPLSIVSTLSRFIEKHGEGLHHICYRVDSISAELEKLKKRGVKLVDPIPRKGSRGNQIAFLHPHSSRSGVLIELCSTRN